MSSDWGKNDWEVVVSNQNGYRLGTYRLKVEGGWLYRYGETNPAVTFVPEKQEPKLLTEYDMPEREY